MRRAATRACCTLHSTCQSQLLSAGAPSAVAGPCAHSTSAGCPARQAASLSSTATQREYSTSDGKLDAGAEEVAELLESSIDKTARIKKRPPLLTTRREALSLYRDVLRHSRLFVWRNEAGRPWGEVIRESARKEFEASKLETDPELINRMIITGRQAVSQAVERFMSKRQAIMAQEEEATAAGLDPARQQPPPV